MAQDNTIEDDIAFMRGLAEQGSRGPVLGGSILFACGLIYSIAAVVSWAFWAEVAPFERPVPGFEWWVAGGVQIVVLAVMIPLFKRASGVPNPASRLFGQVWQWLGTAIFAVFIGVALVSRNLGQEVVWAAMPVAVLAVYGAGWAINAAIAKRRWMYGPSAVSFATAILSAYLINDPVGMLAYGAVIFLTICVPGLILIREASRDERPA